LATDQVSKGQKANKVETLPVKIGSRSYFARVTTSGAPKIVVDEVSFGQGPLHGDFSSGIIKSTALAKRRLRRSERGNSPRWDETADRSALWPRSSAPSFCHGGPGALRCPAERSGNVPRLEVGGEL